VNLQELQERVLSGLLHEVAFEGWTEKALRRGALAAGLAPEDGIRAFPDGAPEVIRFWSAANDRRMLAALAQMDLAAMRVRERIALAVRTRIELDAGHKEAVRRALAYLALPWNAGLGARCLAETVDAIWHACGDTATDLRWYTKRATLAAVYAATVLFWLDDDSEGADASWDFLGRRLDGALRLQRVDFSLSGLFGGLSGRRAAAWTAGRRR
jgi:ubiquinone biosynthesis protein COQ9